jgi:hypothetical protein
MYYGLLVVQKPMYYLSLCHPLPNQFSLLPRGIHIKVHVYKELTIMTSDNLVVKVIYTRSDQEDLKPQ